MSRQLSPSRTAAAGVAVFALALVLIAILSRPGPTPPEPTAAAQASTLPSITASATAAPTATAPATPRPSLKPAFSPCDAPTTLPPIDVATLTAGGSPAVNATDVSMVFASFLYRGGLGGSVVRDDPHGDWAMGLWLARPGGDVRLLAAPEGGMVVPLALSPDGGTAAVWWIEERRTMSEPACDGGIYLLSTVTGESRRMAHGDWTVDPSEADQATWVDPEPALGASRAYRLPHVSFSSDGADVALIDGLTITINDIGLAGVPQVHQGACPVWAWSPSGAVFVGGCEDMTSAWVVDRDEGVVDSYPIPRPPARLDGWESFQGSNIGVTAGGAVRVVRFFGFPTGCETPDCVIPSPAYGVTTIDRPSGAASFRSVDVPFIVNVSFEGHPTRLAADGSWVYAELYSGGARTIRLSSGGISSAKRIGRSVGSALDGSALYGSRIDEAAYRVVVWSVDRFGTRREVGSISWPESTVFGNVVISVVGLIAVAGPA